MTLSESKKTLFTPPKILYLCLIILVNTFSSMTWVIHVACLHVNSMERTEHGGSNGLIKWGSMGIGHQKILSLSLKQGPGDQLKRQQLMTSHGVLWKIPRHRTNTE